MCKLKTYFHKKNNFNAVNRSFKLLELNEYHPAKAFLRQWMIIFPVSLIKLLCHFCSFWRVYHFSIHWLQEFAAAYSA